jgi:hypothetical protein
MMLDVLFVEIASNSHAGAFGSTHGRSYMKDKLTALDEDNFDVSKLVFDDTEYPYQHVDTAVWIARAQKYRVPEAARQIAQSDEVAVVRQRQSLPLDPLGPVDPDVEAPYGFDYGDPDNLMVWWGIGGQFPWQVVPLSVETMEQYDLWESELFKRAGDLQPIVEWHALLRAGRQRQHLDLRAGVPRRQHPRRLRLPPAHPRVLPHRALRRGGRAGRLGDRPEG